MNRSTRFPTAGTTPHPAGSLSNQYQREPSPRQSPEAVLGPCRSIFHIDLSGSPLCGNQTEPLTRHRFPVWGFPVREPHRTNPSPRRRRP